MIRLSAVAAAGLSLWFGILSTPVRAIVSDDIDLYSFDDSPRREALEYPDWFKHTFLDLDDDLKAVVASGKRGLMVYFGQKHCAYCHKLIKVNFGMPDIAEYAKRHFDVVPINIRGIDEVTELDGTTTTEDEFAHKNKIEFTPSIIFYDRDGHKALELNGYYPPYQFRAALEYVADGHYRRESFRAYLERGEGRMVFEPGDLNEEDFYAPPPYNLDRSRMSSERPLAVFFEQGDCHGCDVLHGEELREPAIHGLFEQFDNVQLDMWSDTPVITPKGERTTARKWAEELGLFYSPSIVFFDEKGGEILRVDSVVGFYRLRNVLNFISSKAYLNQPDYRRWRMTQAF